MSVQVIRSAWDKYLSIETEDFTSKMLYAISMFGLLKKDQYEKKDYDRLIWLRDFTHEDVQTPLYELDRYVDSTGGKFTNTNYNLNGEQFSQNKIQYFLCLAIEETTKIIFKTFKKYKIEVALDLDEDDSRDMGDW